MFVIFDGVNGCIWVERNSLGGTGGKSELGGSSSMIMGWFADMGFFGLLWLGDRGFLTIC